MLDWLREALKCFQDRSNLGRRGERIAAKYLEARGLRIIGRNVRHGSTEIDLVATEDSTVVFVEVKSRTHGPGSEVTGLERLDSKKRRALRRACLLYRKRHCQDVESYRLDAVTVEFVKKGTRRTPREIRWYPAILDLDA
jgi:putative endonuclease